MKTVLSTLLLFIGSGVVSFVIVRQLKSDALLTPSDVVIILAACAAAVIIIKRGIETGIEEDKNG